MSNTNKQLDNNSIDWTQFTTLKEKNAITKQESEFPKINKGENIFRIVFTTFTLMAVVTLLVLVFVYPFRDSLNFTYESSYGVLGFICYFLLLLSIVFYALLSYYYDTKYTLSDKKEKFKKLDHLMTYLTTGLVYTTYCAIPLRHQVLEQLTIELFGYKNVSFFAYTNIILLVCVWAVLIALVVIDFKVKDKSKNKMIFLVSNPLISFVILWFGGFLKQNMSLSTVFSVWLLAMASLFYIFSFICSLNEKNHSGMRSASRVFYTFALLTIASVILGYGMIANSKF